MSSDLTRLAIDPPASPRRSRRASGLAPASELFDTLELRNRTITEVYSPLAKMGRSASEGKATLDSSRRSRARSGAVTTKEKEKVTKEQENADGNVFNDNANDDGDLEMAAIHGGHGELSGAELNEAERIGQNVNKNTDR